MFRKYSIAQIHNQFKSGDLDPLAVAEECINRVSRFDPKFRAWVSFNPEILIDNARKLRQSLSNNHDLRPLEGIPVGIKDVFNTVDFPTQMGSKLWLGFTPGNDARVVYYIKNAGGLVVGKTVTAEFAVHALNETLNPHNVKLTPGTSSSGSAVSVALGMVPVALGTQTGGSIIRPASFSGVYGYKPSFGLLPRTACLKTTDSLDTIGFFASHPSDIKRVLEVLRVHGPNFPLSYRALNDKGRQNKPANRPWRIALVKTHTWSYVPDYAKKSLLNFSNLLSAQRDINVIETVLPTGMECAHEIHTLIYDKSLSYYFKEEYKNVEKMSVIMQDLISSGNKISIEDYHAALGEQNRLIEKMDTFFENFDAIISLSTAGAAPMRDFFEKPDSALMWTLTHLPAISVPIFSTEYGEPYGLQIVSRKYNDHLLLDFVDYLVELGLIPKHPSPLLYP